MRYEEGTIMRFKTLAYAAVSLLAISAPAYAQDVPAEDQAAAEDSSDIVVTGTLIRGVAPVGSNSITLGEARIEETGAISANDLLASVPQVTSQFNNVPLADLNIAVNQVQTSRPRIRGIGNAVTATSPTLVLINGHRIAGVGTNQSSVDPDMIPFGAIARVDVMTEGGSATYGADAVAGVINYITRRRFDGVKVDADYGLADDYSQWSGRVTAGKEWATGSAYVSYSYAWTDSLFGRDRDYARTLDYSSLPYRDFNLTCSNPNLTLSTLLVAFVGGPVLANFGNVPYASPGFVQNTANRCDNSENSTLVPKSERHGVFASVNQEIGDRTTIDLRGFYGKRSTEARSEAVGTVGVGPLNPAAATVAAAGLVVGPTGGTFFGFPLENRALVQFSFAPALGTSPLTQSVDLEEYGADLEITHDFTDDWQLKALGNWSQSNSLFNLQQVNQSRLDAAGQAGGATTSLNPLNVASANSALINDIIDNELAGQVKDRLIQLRAIVEGRLASLPGGDIRLAVGAEYMHESLRKRQGTDIRRGTLGTLAYTSYKRNVQSVFGELVVPIIGEGNSFEGAHTLVFSAAGRYDHYSDFGNTFNPKFGLTFEPVKGFRIRGNWGTSFTAPNALDQLGGLNNVIQVAQTAPFQPAGNPAPSTAYSVIIQGSQSPLGPQEATTWSVGVDLEPTPGLKVSASYYDVKFTNIIRIPTPGPDIFTDFATTNFVAPPGGSLSAAQVRDFAAQVPGVSAQVETLISQGQTFYSLIDFRTGNFGVLDLSGLDFSASYVRETSFGSFDLALNGNLQLKRKEQVSPTSATRDVLDRDTSNLSLSASAGVDIGNFRAQATLYHSQGFKLTPTNSVPPQTEIDSFNTVNLFFKYDVPSQSGMLKDLSFTLNVNNVFDAEPPELRRSNPNDRGYGNGFTLGRMFIIGASKKF
jgi:iron complex outermembrane recepter protein